LLASPHTAEFFIELRLDDSGDAARIYVGDTLVAEAATGTNIGRGQVDLLQGALYSITVEFHQMTRATTMSVLWSSREIVQQPIPTFFLGPRWQALKGSPHRVDLV